MTTQTESITLDQLQSTQHDLGPHSPSLTPTSTKALILFGCSLSQLPIWGFSMSYGVLQEFFTESPSPFNNSLTGIIGTTSNGIMYLTMPLLFAILTSRPHLRRKSALLGTVLSTSSYLISSFAQHPYQLVILQGITASLGCSLLYSPITLSQGESFENRALAYGVTLSAKNITGSICPWIFRAALDRVGYARTMQIWSCICAISSLSLFLVPTPESTLRRARGSEQGRQRRISWCFVKHRTFWVYVVAIVLQSAGYGIPQTYLPQYARDGGVGKTSSTLLLTLFNIPGIASSSVFGWLCEDRNRDNDTTGNGQSWRSQRSWKDRISMSATSVSAMSGICSALAAWLLWGMTTDGLGLLVLFSVVFGFFAGGYSATWGGVLNEMEREAARENEAIDTGLVYGLLNGARGVGYVSGGLAGVPLLKAGVGAEMGKFAYGSTYGPLIVFTGLASVFGGWGVLFRC